MSRFLNLLTISTAPPATTTEAEAVNETAAGEPVPTKYPPHPIFAKLRRLEERAINLPGIGKFHAPEKHDVAYYAGMAALITIGVVEWPIALLLVGGHALIRQHHSQTLSAIGEVIEDVWVR